MTYTRYFGTKYFVFIVQYDTEALRTTLTGNNKREHSKKKLTESTTEEIRKFVIKNASPEIAFRALTDESSSHNGFQTKEQFLSHKLEEIGW
jgi:hypothetical protein